ncbi:hypothetical protein [Streptomyces flaveolus]|uniref:hypothetical protein n=1 Tax=Streptomyces flaveolus TaxID=67297 RepID=UPI0033301CBA
MRSASVRDERGAERRWHERFGRPCRSPGVSALEELDGLSYERIAEKVGIVHT